MTRTEALTRAKVYLESWHAQPALTLGPQAAEFVRQLRRLAGVVPAGTG